jgi:hypothetical protein
MSLRWVTLILLLWSSPAFAQCVPVPLSFPLTATVVSTNFAKLYGCFNGGTYAGSNNPVFTGTASFVNAVVHGTLTLMSWLVFPGGVYLEGHDGVLWIHTNGPDAPSFNETNLGITVLTKKGLVQQRVLIGPENSGGIGYRMLRIPNLPTLQ